MSSTEERDAKEEEIIDENYEPLQLSEKNGDEEEGEAGENTIYVVNADNMSTKQLLENFSFVSVEKQGEDEVEEFEREMSVSSKLTDVWSWEETKVLLKIRASKCERMVQAPVGTKCLIWKEISNELKQHGINKSAKACDDKWRTLKMGHSRGLRRAERGIKTKWHYFNAVDDIVRREMSLKTNLEVNNKDHVYHKAAEDDSNEVPDCPGKWTHRTILLLIKYRKKYAQHFGNAKPGVKRKVWKQIAFHLSKIGNPITGDQCSDKWRSLVTRFRVHEEKHRFYPNYKANWIYYGPMEDAVGCELKPSPQGAKEQEVEDMHCFEYSGDFPESEVQVKCNQSIDGAMQTEEDASCNHPVDVFTATLVSEMLHQKNGLLDVMKEQAQNFDARLKRLEEAEARHVEREKERDKKQDELIRKIEMANSLEERKIRVMERYLEKMNKT